MPEAPVSSARPSLRRQAWSRGPQPHWGAPPTAWQSQFRGGLDQAVTDMKIGTFRMSSGGRIRREKPVTFRFDGKLLTGYQGDTVAATLLSHGIHLVARSFKYHRPRGIMAAGIEEPNALMTLGQGNRQEPNIAATVIEAHKDLQVRTQNAWPSVNFDLMAINSLLSPIFVAGFYYKTFMGPTRKAWMFYEHFIRKAAGLGAATEDPGS